LNAEDPPEEATVEHFEGLEHAMIQIVTSIVFPGIGNKVYVAGSTLPGGNQFQNITIADLLALAEPPTSFADISEKGALIAVNFLWMCDVTTICEPQVLVKRLDVGQGVFAKRARHHRKNGEDLRDASYMWGLRILIDSSGIGRKTSLMLIVIQVGAAMALMRTASISADFLMLQLYSDEKKDAYYKCKIVETPDYSDLQDRLNLVQDHQAAQEERAALLGRSHLASHQAGPSVPLGIGPGARGGMPQTILRGRSTGAGV
jgi:hypothetical protein